MLLKIGGAVKLEACTLVGSRDGLSKDKSELSILLYLSDPNLKQIVHFSCFFIVTSGTCGGFGWHRASSPIQFHLLLFDLSPSQDEILVGIQETVDNYAMWQSLMSSIVLQ